MDRANVTQTNFLGGEWAPQSQGRTDHPQYRLAMSKSLNGQPIEEGAWVRRSGTEFICRTYGAGYAKLLSFIESETCAFGMEFTYVSGANGALRFITNDFLICDNTAAPQIQSCSYANPFTITIQASSLPSGWEVGDQIYLVPPASPVYDLTLVNRVMTINSVSNETLTLYDDVNENAIDGSSFAAGSYLLWEVLKVLRLSTPYTSTAICQGLRAVQAETNSIILSSASPIAPQSIVVTPGTLTTDPVPSISATTFIDGPYLDPQGDTATLSGTSGSITVTPNGPSYTFVSTDVGRHVRVFTEPAAWDSGTTYAYGDQVTDQYGAYWISVANGAYVSDNVGVQPGSLYYTSGGVGVVMWMPAPNAGSWSWGIVTSVTNGVATMTLQEALSSTNGTTAITWQLGLFTATGPVYPTCGVNCQGRIWLAGAVLSRFDASTSNQVYPWTGNPVASGSLCFSPTDQYGNVNDDNAISETLNWRELVQIQWLEPGANGLVAGTLAGEFLIQASALGDPLTPNSIQSQFVTAYGANTVPPVHAGMAIIYSQKYGRRVLEYLEDAFSGKLGARHLNEMSKHLTASGIIEMTYQEELAPTIWVLAENGTLSGYVYRRFSRFSSTPPECQGAFQVALGSPDVPRAGMSMCTVPENTGLLDRLFIATNDASETNGFIEIMQPLPDEPVIFGQEWLLDSSPGPGPGNSGSDCGGGNVATYTATSGITGVGSVSDPIPVIGGPLALLPTLPPSGTVSPPTTQSGGAPKTKLKHIKLTFINQYSVALTPLTAQVSVALTGSVYENNASLNNKWGNGSCYNCTIENGATITDASQPFFSNMEVTAGAWNRGDGDTVTAQWAFTLTASNPSESTSNILSSSTYTGNNVQPASFSTGVELSTVGSLAGTWSDLPGITGYTGECTLSGAIAWTAGQVATYAGAPTALGGEASNWTIITRGAAILGKYLSSIATFGNGQYLFTIFPGGGVSDYGSSVYSNFQFNF